MSFKLVREDRQEEKPKGFDLTVHKRDPKTGLVVDANPYRLRCIGSMKIFERPIGSGNIWNKKGEPAGRFVDGKYDEKAEHIEFKMPESGDQKLAREYTEQQMKIQELERELASIKAEKAKKEKGS